MFKSIKERGFHLLFLAFLIGLFIGVNFSMHVRADEPAHTYLDYFHQVYQLIRSDYVDKTDTKKVFYGAIRGMIQALNDPYSRFLDEDSYAELREETTGKFVGVGVEITSRDGDIVVISPIEDTPAMKAGIKSGDVITRVNDIAIKNKDISEIIKLIRGLAHTKVKLAIQREGSDEPLLYELERMPIKLESVNYSTLSQEGIGYIKVKMFSSDTSREIEKALKEFNEKGIGKLIVDLRWNPGGLLDKAISISEFFLDRGKIIVSTRGREGTANVKEYLSEKQALYKGKLVLLVNKGSASASEIVSGAVKDNGRGVLVGEKTFGKGSVQKFFNLNDDIGITLTIAKYYTPSGVSIHGTGIMPDHSVPMETIPDADRKNINLIVRDRIAETFVKNNKGYNAENRKKFIELLTEKNLSISEKSANYILKTEMNRYTRQPLYDLEFDTQMKKAIEILNGRP
jgi:carboxyl-terminal processing protease